MKNKNKKTWLVLDCNYLCYRALYSMKGLTNGVIYGFLKAVLELQERFGTPLIAFCWDYGQNKRYKIFDGYKAGRQLRHKDAEESKLIEEGKNQMELLRLEYLPRLLKHNNLYKYGYESDDIIASVCNTAATETNPKNIIIVTADQDLYQCITTKVSCYNPQKKEFMTYSLFNKKYNIPPYDWANVKAIAGCTSDSIPGIKGVGEKTAIKSIRGEKISDRIEQMLYTDYHCNHSVIKRNIKLVKLPLPGTPPFHLVNDMLNLSELRKLTKELKMPSLIKKIVKPKIKITKKKNTLLRI